MVSSKVEALRQIGVHRTVIQATGSNRHQRRAEEAKAHNFSFLAQRKPVDWRAKRVAARRQAAVSRKRNR